MAEMSLDVQIQKTHEVKKLLDEFCVKLNTGMTDLKNKLDNNRSMGFPKEIAARYEATYYKPEKAKIDQLVQTIKSAHHNYLNGVIAEFDATKNLN